MFVLIIFAAIAAVLIGIYLGVQYLNRQGRRH